MSTLEIDQKRLKELAVRAAYSYAPSFTKFLEPSAERDCMHAAAASGTQVSFYGGTEHAERRVAAFYADTALEEDEFPIACLKITWNERYANPGHRDLLGSLMGLGIVRQSMGDILVGNGEAYLFVLSDVAQYICANMESAGRAKLKIEPAKADIELPEPEGKLIRETIPSERLDAVLAAGYDLSRTEAQRLIRSGLVKRNHVVELRPDVKLAEGDLLSARGYGRLKIEAFLGQTRRGRYAIQLFRFGK